MSKSLKLHRSAAMYADVELITGELDGFVSFIQALDWLGLKATQDKALGSALARRAVSAIPFRSLVEGKCRKAGWRSRRRSTAFTAIWKRARALIARGAVSQLADQLSSEYGITGPA